MSHVTQKLLQKLVGLLVHPAMHKRILMSLLQDTYMFISNMKPRGLVRMPVGVKEELLWLGLCLPVAHSNIRWPISCRIGASDASLSGGGRAACLTDQSVANTLYRFSEHSGEHVKLDWQQGALEPPSMMASAPSELEQLMNAHAWSATHQCKFNHKQHINILEMKMVKAELKGLVKQQSEPHRAVLLVDSRVVVGAFSKGRSSSRQLNRILRSMVGWLIAGQVSLHLIWVGTKANPADHPSRGAKIPDPVPGDPILSELLAHMPAEARSELQRRKSNRVITKNALREQTFSNVGLADSVAPVPGAGGETIRHPAIKQWTFREIFAGKGHLSRAFQRGSGFQVAPAVELFQRGRPCSSHDILDDRTFGKLCRDACKPRQIWHFGMPCNSFSILQGLNGGTRSKENPSGDGSLAREVKGNELLKRTVYLCQLLHKHGSFFTIENPQSSYAWHMPQMQKLLRKCNAQHVVLDQCEFGLTIPGPEGEPMLARKSTTFAGTLPNLEKLGRKCSKQHEHAQVIGSVKTQTGWEKRSTLAGAYPWELCKAYHGMCKRLFDN